VHVQVFDGTLDRRDLRLDFGQACARVIELALDPANFLLDGSQDALVQFIHLFPDWSFT